MPNQFKNKNSYREITKASRFLDQLENEEHIVSIDGILKAVEEEY